MKSGSPANGSGAVKEALEKDLDVKCENLSVIDFKPLISNVVVRFIADADSSLSSLRNGEIHLFNGVPETKYELVENDDKLFLQKNESNAVSYLLFNTADRDVATSEDLRKAVLYSINQDEFLSYYQGNKKKAFSTVSPLVNTGNELVGESAKVKEFLEKYKASKQIKVKEHPCIGMLFFCVTHSIRCSLLNALLQKTTLE